MMLPVPPTTGKVDDDDDDIIRNSATRELPLRCREFGERLIRKSACHCALPQ